MADVTVFHGLFVGLDHYQNPGFDGLRFARRDAEVLHSLFLDTFMGGSATLVTDVEATKDRMLTEICQLQQVATESDIVMITFSGHGTPSRELATYDAVSDRLADTAFRLTDFIGLVDQIPAQLLIVVLDCCFSGSALTETLRQATVTHQPKSMWQLEAEYTSRSTDAEIDELLNRVRGRGKVVLAASAADERAYEKAEFGHGVLTHYLIEGMLGRGDVADRDGVSVLKLVDYVLTRVGWHRHGVVATSQNAMFEGALGDVRLPIFTPGPHYAQVGGTIPPHATPAPSSLVEHGIPEQFVGLWGAEFELNDVQLAAVNAAGVLRGEPVLVNAPTGSGKTLVGELAAVRAKHNGKRTVFLLPSRTLVNEQYDRFRALYGPLGIKVIRATGELRDHLPDLHRGQYDIAVLTYEKFTGLLSGNPGLLDRIGVLVLDEIHSLFDPHRGPGLEALLTRMRRESVSGGVPQLVGLSAVLGDPTGLANWLGVTPVISNTRPVPLVEGTVGPDGRFFGRRYEADETTDVDEPRWIEPVDAASREDVIAAVVAKLVAQQQQVIVFRGTRDAVRATATRLKDTLRLLPAERESAALPRGDAGTLHDQLVTCLRGGVAFHMADLSDVQRRVVEESFRRRDSAIRVVVATTTLAQGVNLPADAVVICELKHPDDADYSVAEYKNMAGRAGRPGYGVAEGRSVIVTEGGADTEDKHRRYVTAGSDAAGSALLASSVDLSTLVLTVLSAVSAHHGRSSEVDIHDFFDRTLATHQARRDRQQRPFLRERVQQAVKHLLQEDFLQETAKGLALTRLGEVVVRRGLSVSSVATVASALGSIEAEELNRETLLCAAQLTPELHDVRFARAVYRRTAANDEMGSWLRRSGAAAAVVAPLLAMTEGAGDAAARRAIASMSWIRGRTLSQIEQGLQRTMPRGRRSDPGPVLHAMRRAASVIGAVIDIASHVVPAASLGDLSDVLPAQQELGIIAGHVPIARHLDVDPSRDIFLGLLRGQLNDYTAILEADELRVLECVGGDRETLRAVLAAAHAAKAEAEEPTLDDLLPPCDDIDRPSTE